MKKAYRVSAIVLFVAAVFLPVASAASSPVAGAADFYKGKTISYLVGYAPGVCMTWLLG